MREHLVEGVIAVIEREVGHVDMFARIEVERAVWAAIDEAAYRSWALESEPGDDAPPMTIPPPPPEGLEAGYAAPTVRPATHHPVDAPGRSCGVCARLRRLFRWRA